MQNLKTIPIGLLIVLAVGFLPSPSVFALRALAGLESDPVLAGLEEKFQEQEDSAPGFEALLVLLRMRPEEFQEKLESGTLPLVSPLILGHTTLRLNYVRIRVAPGFYEKLYLPPAAAGKRWILEMTRGGVERGRYLLHSRLVNPENRKDVVENVIFQICPWTKPLRNDTGKDLSIMAVWRVNPPSRRNSLMSKSRARALTDLMQLTPEAMAEKLSEGLPDLNGIIGVAGTQGRIFLPFGEKGPPYYAWSVGTGEKGSLITIDQSRMVSDYLQFRVRSDRLGEEEDPIYYWFQIGPSQMVIPGLERPVLKLIPLKRRTLSPSFNYTNSHYRTLIDLLRMSPEQFQERLAEGTLPLLSTFELGKVESQGQLPIRLGQGFRVRLSMPGLGARKGWVGNLVESEINQGRYLFLLELIHPADLKDRVDGIVFQIGPETSMVRNQWGKPLRVMRVKRLLPPVGDRTPLGEKPGLKELARLIQLDPESLKRELQSGPPVELKGSMGVTVYKGNIIIPLATIPTLHYFWYLLGSGGEGYEVAIEENRLINGQLQFQLSFRKGRERLPDRWYQMGPGRKEIRSHGVTRTISDLISLEKIEREQRKREAPAGFLGFERTGEGRVLEGVDDRPRPEEEAQSRETAAIIREFLGQMTAGWGETDKAIALELLRLQVNLEIDDQGAGRIAESLGVPSSHVQQVIERLREGFRPLARELGIIEGSGPLAGLEENEARTRLLRQMIANLDGVDAAPIREENPAVFQESL